MKKIISLMMVFMISFVVFAEENVVIYEIDSINNSESVEEAAQETVEDIEIEETPEISADPEDFEADIDNINIRKVEKVEIIHENNHDFGHGIFNLKERSINGIIGENDRYIHIEFETQYGVDFTVNCTFYDINNNLISEEPQFREFAKADAAPLQIRHFKQILVPEVAHSFIYSIDTCDENNNILSTESRTLYIDNLLPLEQSYESLPDLYESSPTSRAEREEIQSITERGGLSAKNFFEDEQQLNQGYSVQSAIANTADIIPYNDSISFSVASGEKSFEIEIAGGSYAKLNTSTAFTCTKNWSFLLEEYGYYEHVYSLKTEGVVKIYEENPYTGNITFIKQDYCMPGNRDIIVSNNMDFTRIFHIKFLPAEIMHEYISHTYFYGRYIPDPPIITYESAKTDYTVYTTSGELEPSKILKPSVDLFVRHDKGIYPQSAESYNSAAFGWLAPYGGEDLQIGTNNNANSATGAYREAFMRFDLTDEQITAIRNIPNNSADRIIFSLYVNSIVGNAKERTIDLHLLPSRKVSAVNTDYPKLKLDSNQNLIQDTSLSYTWMSMYDAFSAGITAREFLRYKNPSIVTPENMNNPTNLAPATASSDIIYYNKPGTENTALGGRYFNFDLTEALREYFNADGNLNTKSFAFVLSSVRGQGLITVGSTRAEDRTSPKLTIPMKETYNKSYVDVPSSADLFVRQDKGIYPQTAASYKSGAFAWHSPYTAADLQIGTNNNANSATGAYREAFIRFDMTPGQIQAIKNASGAKGDKVVFSLFVKSIVGTAEERTIDLHLVPSDKVSAINTGYPKWKLNSNNNVIQDTADADTWMSMYDAFSAGITVREFLRYKNPSTVTSANMNNSSNLAPVAASSEIIYNNKAGTENAPLGRYFEFDLTAALKTYFNANGNENADGFGLALSSVRGQGLVTCATMRAGTETTPKLSIPFTDERANEAFNIDITANTQSDTIRLAAENTLVGDTFDLVFEASGGLKKIKEIPAENNVTLHNNINVPSIECEDDLYDVTVILKNYGGATKSVKKVNLTLNTLKVLFESCGGTEIAAVKSVPVNTKITEPVPPTKKYYDFIGWYKDSNYISAWNFSENTVTENVTLYAKWAPKSNGENCEIDGSKIITKPSVERYIRSDMGINPQTEANYLKKGANGLKLDYYGNETTEIGSDSNGAYSEGILKYDLEFFDLKAILGSSQNDVILSCTLKNSQIEASQDEKTISAYLIPYDKAYLLHANYPQKLYGNGTADPLSQEMGLSAYDMYLSEITAREFLKNNQPAATATISKSAPAGTELSFDLTQALISYFAENPKAKGFAVVLANTTDSDSITAIYGSQSAEYGPKLYIPAYEGKIFSSTITCSQNKNYNVVISSQNMIQDKICTIQYDANKLEVTDLCSLTYEKELEIGYIADMGINILEFTEGNIKFTVGRYEYTGAVSTILNSISFSSKIDNANADISVVIENSENLIEE